MSERGRYVTNLANVNEDPGKPSLSTSEVDRAVGLHNIARSVMKALAGRTVGALDEAIDQALAEVGKFCGVDRAYVFEFHSGAR